MTQTFAERLREDRRLVLLRLLSEQVGYALNSSNLTAGLQHLHVPGLRADVLDDLRWLRDSGLVRLESLADIPGLYGVTLTHSGLDVARGREVAAGVSQPAPK